MPKILTLMFFFGIGHFAHGRSQECQHTLTLHGEPHRISFSHFSVWKEPLKTMDIRGLRFDGDHVYAAIPSADGPEVADFFNLEATPKHLLTTEYLHPHETIFALQSDINIQNRPLYTPDKLVWTVIDDYLPRDLVKLMNTEFADGTNCFGIALLFSGVIEEPGFVSGFDFQKSIDANFSPANSAGGDIAVIYRRGMPIHAYLPIGSTGWVLTKNGSGRLLALRFMRESDLKAYYSTLRDRSSLHRERFSWELPVAEPSIIKYFDRRR